MKKHFFLVLFAISLACTLTAGTVPVQTAQTVALNFFKNVAISNTGTNTATLKYTKTEPNGDVDFYVFDITPSNGFVIISAEDNAEPILGYSTEGNFSTNIKGSPINDWITNTSTKIRKIVQMQIPADTRINSLWNGYQLGTISNNRSSRSSTVAPMLTTTWNQDPYYNNLCPYNSTDQQRCVTGCVATAMAQIMKFWNYPAHGTGSYSYTPGSYPSYGVQSANFGATTYNWSNMPTAISSSNATDIATLMYHCGVAVAMDYGDYNQGGSGAYVIGTSYPSAQKAYGTYFSYNASAMKGIYMSNYTSATWIAALEAELNAGRPIQYMGFDPGGGGHTWVCDGYDANGLMHMNWGWGGYGNGYFSVTNLSVAGYNFSTDDAALIGIQPGTLSACNAPAGLGSSAITTTTATVSWGAVTGATSYNLQYKATSASTWTTVSVAGTSSNLTGLTAGTSYQFQVQTVCSGGSSSYSTASTFTTLTACGVPASLTASAITTSGATLSWGAVTGATSYNLQYKLSSASTWNTINVSTTSSSVAGLASSSTYNYQVQTVCSSGSSAYSTASSFTTSAAPTCGVPGSLAATSITTSGATLSWGVVTGATSYNLQYKLSSASTWNTINVSTTSSTVAGLASSSTYNYQVQTVCSSGSSAYSTASSFTTGTAATCGVPASLSATSITTSGATLNWGAVSGATSYNVQYKLSSASTWSTINVSTTSATIVGLTAGSTYNYQVQTVCSSGSSNYSTAASFTTQTSCGIAIGLAASSITTNSAIVLWVAVTGSLSYNLQYKASTASTWTTIPVTGITYTLTGLTAGTSYNFQVQTVCSGGSSTYTTASTFTTLTSCGVASGLASSAITTSSATVSWGAVSGATSYNLQYKTSAGTTWTTVSTSANSYNLTGLAAGTIYNFQVQTICSSGSSAYSTAGSFTTTSSGTVTYCTLKGSTTQYEYIKSIAVGTFSNTSGNNSGYANYTNLTIPLASGTTKTFTLTPGFGGIGYSEYWTVFIDYNKNGSFTDAGETVYTSSAGSATAVIANIAVPAGLSGTTTMRVVMSYTAVYSPCGSYTFGETEDYTVNFSSTGMLGGLSPEEENGGTFNTETESELSTPVLYPNPATNQVNIVLTPVDDLPMKVELISITGQVLASQIPNTSDRIATIDLSELVPGIYLVRTYTGDRARTEKLIKQ